MDTLASPAAHALQIKHSRFLAQARPLESAEDAPRKLQTLSDAGATHNCWAWRFGDQYRSSDDGEPAGTAGRPILAAIDGQGYDRVLVVVARWYGGVKLGAGGLVRAYGGAAAECLRQAERCPLVAEVQIAIYCEFESLGHLHAALRAFGGQKLDERFGPEGACLRLRIARDRLDDLKTRVRDATRDRVRFEFSP